MFITRLCKRVLKDIMLELIVRHFHVELHCLPFLSCMKAYLLYLIKLLTSPTAPT
jgi:hypothetical protein